MREGHRADPILPCFYHLQETAVPVAAMLNAADFSYAGHNALESRTDMLLLGSRH